MKTIYKYVLPFPKNDEHGIEIIMPYGAKMLHVGVQEDRAGVREDICVWALVETSASAEPYRFWIHGTGHPVTNTLTPEVYLGTVHMRAGALVFHVFGGIRSREARGL